ncbi:KamA family radical SAM protein [Desulfonatronovibrio hydrogenovorans]|uniref:KamA family radical SAM protein n=1 Tax=Desulfonatronovibrio hydrogenovorans TaxID=53245 RepID=UPI000A065C77|nr:KamA family radical SAM protein [Desulfonatronovibrio hydrogenovorans]
MDKLEQIEVETEPPSEDPPAAYDLGFRAESLFHPTIRTISHSSHNIFEFSPQEFRRTHYKRVSDRDWNDWKWQVQNRITRFPDLEKILPLSGQELQAGSGQDLLPMSITPYYLSLIHPFDPDDPIRKCVVPTGLEFKKGLGEENDPLHEDRDSPVPGIVHRYPDRVLFLATGFCSTYCRYCTRSRMVGHDSLGHPEKWIKAIDYVKNNPLVRDVLISGGDPLTMGDDQLQYILEKLRAIRHVEIIRIGTKVPAVLPQRITRSLCKMLKKFHPLFLSLHFTHPREMTEQAAQACSRLADAGIPLGSQTVLLKGINDQTSILKNLYHKLLVARVRPYYLYQCDPIPGSNHFRTTIEKGKEMIQGLRGHTSGYAVPQYVIDLPGGGGKTPVLPGYYQGRTSTGLVFKNFENRHYVYPDQSMAENQAGMNLVAPENIAGGAQ